MFPFQRLQAHPRMSPIPVFGVPRDVTGSAGPLSVGRIRGGVAIVKGLVLLKALLLQRLIQGEHGVVHKPEEESPHVGGPRPKHVHILYS